MKLIVTKCKSRKVYEMPVHSGISMEFNKKACSVLKFKQSIIKTRIDIGDIVELWEGTVLLWNGIVFDVATDFTVTAVDKLRYLKNKDVRSYKEDKITVDTLLEDECSVLGLPYERGAVSYYMQPDVELDNAEILGTIYEMLDESLSKTGAEMILYGHKGVITLKMQSDCTYRRQLNITKYAQKRSISDETANQIVLYDKNKVDFVTATDYESVRYYGVLRMIKVAGEEKKEDMAKWANEYLKLRNTIRIELTVECIGGVELLDIIQGWLIPITIDDEENDVHINNYFIVESASHTIIDGLVESKLRVMNYSEELV